MNDIKLKNLMDTYNKTNNCKICEIKENNKELKNINPYFSKSLQEKYEEIKNSLKNIVLIGQVGGGKTTIINRVCQKDFFTQDCGFQCTTEVQFSYSLKNKDIILDFPGLYSSSFPIKNLKIHKCVLTAIPLRMICIVIKFNSRYDILIKEGYQMIEIFKEYKHNILVIITNTEKINIKEKSEIETLFKIKFRIDYILFTKLDMDGFFLSDTLHNYMMRMANIKEVRIESRELFKTLGTDYSNLEICEDKDKFLSDFNEALQIFRKEFNKAEDKELKREIFFAFKRYKDELIESYNEILKKKVLINDNEEYFTELITFNNSMFHEYDAFRRQAENELQLQQTNYRNGQPTRYKKCPHCGEIWFIIKGCNTIVCGKRCKLKDKVWGTFKKYVVKFSNGNITYQIIEGNNNQLEGEDVEIFGLFNEEKKRNIELKSLGRKEITPRGCGKKSNWDEMEDVTCCVDNFLKSIPLTDYDSKVQEIIEDMEKK